MYGARGESKLSKTNIEKTKRLTIENEITVRPQVVYDLTTFESHEKTGGRDTSAQEYIQH